MLNPVTAVWEGLPSKPASAHLKDEETTINETMSFTVNPGNMTILNKAVSCRRDCFSLVNKLSCCISFPSCSRNGAQTCCFSIG